MNVLLLFTIMISNLVTNSFPVTFNGDTIGDIRVDEVLLPAPFPPLLNENRVKNLADELSKRIEKEPVNAKVDEYGNIVPEVSGIKLNEQAFYNRLSTHIYSNDPNSLEIPIKTVHPKVDSELLANIKTDMIGYYITYFNSANKQRSGNISLAADAINNVVVFPGERFSFNRTVGKRTTAKGYLPAPIIVKGELTEGIGGGICQVSSTLFNAVDGAGLTIIERYSHSKRVRYVPSGRDATVSWYGPDFVFQNNYNQPILIRAQARAGKLIVRIFSSDSIQYTPRHIPRMSGKLPEETPAQLQ
jgi:vancomycin resistance protein YoaR